MASFDINVNNIREIEGATVQGDALVFPACPEEFSAFIKETDFCDLIYWKLLMEYEDLNTKVSQEILKSVQNQVERPLFYFVLKKTKGNQSKAAELLGCNRNTLHRKLKDFCIEPKELRKNLKSSLKKTSKRTLKKDSLEKTVEI